MHINELTSSFLAHESRMNRYDYTPLENAFKSQLNVTRGRGKGRSSNIGRRGRSDSHSDSRNDSKNEEKLQQNTLSVRGSSNRTR